MEKRRGKFSLTWRPADGGVDPAPRRAGRVLEGPDRVVKASGAVADRLGLPGGEVLGRGVERGLRHVGLHLNVGVGREVERIARLCSGSINVSANAARWRRLSCGESRAAELSLQ